MKRQLHICCLLLSIALFSCSKTTQTPSYPSYYGKWQFIAWSFGPSYNIPSPDSVVLLTLKQGNTYTATLNGAISLQGSFTIDSSNGVTLKFLNINEPYGTNTIVVTNNTTFLFFNTAKIGQLTLFQNNLTSSPGDTLMLTSSPITPDPTYSWFKRIQ
jgi:hypothetical protein